MENGFMPGRRVFAGLLAGAAIATVSRSSEGRAAAPDGIGAIANMLTALTTAKALSFTAQSNFGASVARDRLRTLGERVSVVFERPDTLFAVFGAGGEPDVQMLISGGEATLFRLSLASKTVLKLSPESGAAFMVPGFFFPFLGLLANDPETEFFGGIKSVTPLAQGAPSQPEQTTLAAVMGGRFTGEVWVDTSVGLPTRTTGTWFGAKGDMAASASVDFSGWSTSVPAVGAFAPKGLDKARSVELEALGL